MSRLKVVVESPYAGQRWTNEKYVRAAMADCFRRGEFPFASHALYTQEGVLDDEKPEERALGMEAGFAWGDCADRTVVYVDRGVSSGMKKGIERARLVGRPVEFRTVPGWDDKIGEVNAEKAKAEIEVEGQHVPLATELEAAALEPPAVLAVVDGKADFDANNTTYDDGQPF